MDSLVILQFALIFEKEWAGGQNQASTVTFPGEKIVEVISKTRMIPRGTDALSPAL